MLTVLKLSLSHNQQYIKIDLNNLQELNQDKVAKKQKLDVYKFRIDVKDDDVNKCREVLPVTIYSAGYCCYAVLKKIKCNIYKKFISR